MTRRTLLQSAALAAFTPLAANLHAALAPDPVPIASIELLKNGKTHIVRATAKDGAIGHAICNERADYLYPILLKKVAPHFINKDARDLPALIDSVYTASSNYKLQGIAFWCPVAWCEFAILDLLGRRANKPVAALLGDVLRKQIPVYLSSLRRDTTPQQEVDWLSKRIEETAAKAVKLKIGGRMSKNKDASPGRSESLVKLARKTWGDAMTIYVDANGSYDAPHAIEVGKMLQDHNVAFFEEPCEWEDYQATRKVAAALDIPIAGGEQDSSLYRFEEMIRDNVIDIVQPDMTYNGGLHRAIRVAEMAAAKKMPITPHSPARAGNEPYILHFAAATPNIGPFIEFNAAPQKSPGWLKPAFEPQDGKLTLPQGPGWGLEIAEDFLKSATPVKPVQS